jgi:antitoxin ParD1/3/4
MLLEGLNSGNATEMTAQDWEDIRQAVEHFDRLKLTN